MKKLTIGMSTYDDYDGVYFSIQALKIYQLDFLNKDYEIIVVDNNPNSIHGKETKKFVQDWAGGKYIPYTDQTSTFTKYEIFKYAESEYTLCLDSHVLFEQNAIKNLLNYYDKNPNTNNLIQGPLWYDDLNNISTHFDTIWRDIMYGIWATNKESYDSGEPFEIPMMGMGMFSCKTSKWPGINANFKGFGGEEGYIHEKFRQAGGRCICLPNLRWNHRFGRPNGVPYPNILEDRVWNYFVGWLELLKNPDDPFFQTIFDTFKNKIPEPVIKQLFEKAKQL